MKARLATIDVFDTVLTRVVGRPEALFLLLGRLQVGHLGAVTPEVFARARQQAERRARDRNGEGTQLTHIAREMAFALDLTPEQEWALIGAELDLEARLLRPVPRASLWVGEVRRSIGKVAFLSDTYLPSPFVRDQLVRHGLWSQGDSLYASCEVAAEKRGGRLFHTVARTEHVRRWSVHHHGNDPEGDVRSPRRAGLRVTPVTAANLNRFEERLEDFRFETNGLSSLLAGASRTARLAKVTASAAEGAVRDVTAGVVGPVLVAYVLSVLRGAVRCGLQRLYFVSRDGEVLLLIARGLAERVGFAGELLYLYGSRQAWNLAGVTEVSDRELDWMLDEWWSASVRTVLDRVAITPEEIALPLAEAGFPADEWSRNLSSGDRARLRAMFVRSPVVDLICARGESRRPSLVRYLRQAGLFDKIPYGVVDLGWYGRAGAALSSVLRREGADGPQTYFYLGLHRRPPPEIRDRCRAYLFDGGANVGADIAPMPGVVNLLETFCAGSHGQVLGYEVDGPEVKPVLKGGVNDAALAWGLPTLRTTIDHFVAELVLDQPLADLDSDLRAAVVALLELFVVHPTRTEAEAWGAVVFSGDQNEALPRRLANPYSLAEVVAGIASHSPRDREGPDWVFASKRLSSPGIQLFLGRPFQLLARVKATLGIVRGKVGHR